MISVSAGDGMTNDRQTNPIANARTKPIAIFMGYRGGSASLPWEEHDPPKQTQCDREHDVRANQVLRRRQRDIEVSTPRANDDPEPSRRGQRSSRCFSRWWAKEVACERVGKELVLAVDETKAVEVMIVSDVYDHAKQLRSFELIAAAWTTVDQFDGLPP